MKAEKLVRETAQVLSPGQVQFFKENGYLVVEDLIDPTTFGRWQESIFERFNVSPESDEVPVLDVETQRSIFKDFFLPPESLPSRQSRLLNVIEQLSGSTLECSDEQLFIIRQSPHKEWEAPEVGHIDLLFRALRLRFMLGVTTYVHKVSPKGGGFYFWPGSHLVTWRYFQEFPGHYYVEGIKESLYWVQEQIAKRLTCDPMEFTAEPGAALIWHACLFHNASMNVNRFPRFAVISRWGQPLKVDEQQETFGDIWEHWAI